MPEQTKKQGRRGSPPIVDLSATRNWTLSIVLYPSGPCLELVEPIEGGSRIAYSETLLNLDLAAKVLKENTP